MDYDQFDAEYGQVLISARSLDAAALSAEVTRLRSLADTVQPASGREAALLLIASLEDALARPQPALSEAMAAAVRVTSHARTAEGTRAEQVERLRAGIDEITGLAAVAHEAERGAILDLNEPLRLLLDSLTASHPAGNTNGR